MNPQSTAPSITDQIDPKTVVHVVVIVLVILVVYHFMFHR